MMVEKFVSGFLDTNTYLLEEDGHLLVVDPSDHAAVLDRCKEATNVTVLLTHEHFDHISGLNRIRDLCASSCRVIAGATCSKRIQNTKANLSAYADVLAEKLPDQLQPGALLQGECLQEKLLTGNRITRVYPGHGDVMTPEVALGLIRGV